MCDPRRDRGSRPTRYVITDPPAAYLTAEQATHHAHEAHLTTRQHWYPRAGPPTTTCCAQAGAQRAHTPVSSPAFAPGSSPSTVTLAYHIARLESRARGRPGSLGGSAVAPSLRGTRTVSLGHVTTANPPPHRHPRRCPPPPVQCHRGAHMLTVTEPTVRLISDTSLRPAWPCNGLPSPHTRRTKRHPAA